MASLRHTVMKCFYASQYVPGASRGPKNEKIPLLAIIILPEPKLQSLLGTQVTFHWAPLQVMFCEANYKMLSPVGAVSF